MSLKAGVACVDIQSIKCCQVSSVGLHLDHDVTLEVVLKALELKLQDGWKVIKQHPFACILQQWHLASIFTASRLPSGALLQGLSNIQLPYVLQQELDGSVVHV